jgi:cytochrome P450
MAAPLIHLNPDVFSDPLEFRPERFIENPQLKRYLMTFSQGSRQCLGMQLAYAELFLIHSEIWRRFGSKENHGEAGWWELFETDRSDTDMVSDRFLPYPRADSKGIRIKVHK